MSARSGPQTSSSGRENCRVRESCMICMRVTHWSLECNGACGPLRQATIPGKLTDAAMEFCPGRAGGLPGSSSSADVAQLVEQLIRNQ